MPDAFKTIGIIGKYGDPSVGGTVQQLSQYLQGRNHEVVLDASSADILPGGGLEVVDRTELGTRCDLAMIVGGDGTLLSAARTLAEYDLPLLGINLGRLGFLVDISPHEMIERLDDILAGHYLDEHRLMLHTTIHHEGEQASDSEALNDVVVHKWEVARMIEVETYIDGYFLTTMRSDGLIVATPTGSTAYALSGGGPILHPTLNAMVLVPICSHTMSNRPIVIGGDSRIEIVITDTPYSHAQVTCDGQINLGLVSGDRICIRKHEHAVRLLHPADHDHLEILRAKLHWGEKL